MVMITRIGTYPILLRSRITFILTFLWNIRVSTVWADPDRGHSPEIWNRALGWYSMALVDTLAIIPFTHPGHNALLSTLRTLAPRIAAATDPTSGVWWLVLTQPGRPQNYFESSGATMFVYALLKAVRLGYVSDPDGDRCKREEGI